MIDKRLEEKIHREVDNEFRYPTGQKRYYLDRKSFEEGAQFVIDFLKTAECLIWRRAGEIESYSKQAGSCALILARKYDKFNGMEYKHFNLNDLQGFQMQVFVAADYEWAVLPDRPQKNDMEEERERQRRLSITKGVADYFGEAIRKYPLTPGECFDPITMSGIGGIQNVLRIKKLGNQK